MAIGENMSKREQTLVAIAILAFGALGAYWYFLYNPRATELNATAAHVDSLEVANGQVKGAAGVEAVKRLRDDGTQYSSALRVMRTLVPTENEVPALLDNVSTAARRAGLELAGVEPLPVLPGEQFDTYRYKMSVIGGYHAVGEFLGNVGSLDRIVAPVSVDMKPHAPGDKTKRIKPGESLLDTSFELQTYVSRTSPYVAPGASQ